MSATELAEKLLALAVGLQSLENLALRGAWSDAGIWRWRDLRLDYPAPVRAALDPLLNARSFLVLQIVAFGAAIAMALAPSTPALAVLFLAPWLAAIRWRGTFNGGADCMTLVVALGLLVARAAPGLARPAILYIAVQVTASYFIAGVAKLRNPLWRSGQALLLFFETPGYDHPPAWIRAAVRRAPRALALGVIAFECAFPLAWASPSLAAFLIALAIPFHLFNFAALGLNRFVFAWLAAYPALWYFAARGA